MAHLYIFVGAELAGMCATIYKNTIQNLTVVKACFLKRFLNIHKYLIVCSFSVFCMFIPVN